MQFCFVWGGLLFVCLLLFLLFFGGWTWPMVIDKIAALESG